MYKIIRPIIFYLDPEFAHSIIHFILKGVQLIPGLTSVINYFYSYPSSRFVQNIFGVEFKNPVGLAAGFDKNAEICDSMSAFEFGFLELGSVTNMPSEGNPKPRMFRLEKDKALINRMGLNNKGPYAFLKSYHAAKTDIPLFINIAKTNNPAIVDDAALKDIIDCYSLVGDSAKVIVLNLSCPNTNDGRTFEDPSKLSWLLDAIFKVKQEKSFTHSLLVRFSNDVSLDLLEQLANISISSGVDGFVLGNTSVCRNGLNESIDSLSSIGKGGLSGEPIYKRALERVSFLYKLSDGKLPVIAVGGISTPEQAYEMITNGASLVAIYTALVYEGPAVVKRILEGLEQELNSRGILNIEEIVGSSLQKS